MGARRGKSLQWFDFAGRTTDADFIFKQDADTAVCPPLLHEWLEHAARRGAQYLGWMHTNASCGGGDSGPPAPDGHENERPAWTYASGAFYGVNRAVAVSFLHD